jgi:hypothetical protein
MDVMVLERGIYLWGLFAMSRPDGLIKGLFENARQIFKSTYEVAVMKNTWHL